MSVPALAELYDAGLPKSLAIGTVTATSYCVQSTVRAVTVYKDGPFAAIEQGSC